MEDFNPGWIAYLKIIGKNEGIVSDELAKILMVSKPAITKTIQKLLELNYCEARVNNEDRRSKKLYLTKEGESQLSKIKPLLKGVQEKALEGFSEDEKEMFDALIDKVLANIDKK